MDENESTAEAGTGPDTPKDEERKVGEIYKDMSTKEAYFASLEEWVKQAALVQMFHNYLLANYRYSHLPQTQLPFPAPAPGTEYLQTNRQAQQQPQPQPAQGNAPGVRFSFSRFRLLTEAQQQDIIRSVGGIEMVVAPFWKRAVAEAIDVFLLLLLKIIITFSLFHAFDLDFDKDVMRKPLDDDDIFINFFDVSMDFFTISSDLFLIELLTKLIVCWYECLWTVFYNGATPGKSIMKIRLVYVEAVLPLQAAVLPQFVFQPQREPFRALLYPAETPTLLRALMRALAKNIVTTLLFPICVIMVFFKNNRTAYDIITKTIVVETNSRRAAPVAAPQVPLQRPHQQ